MSLPQTTPAYIALMPSFPSFILHFLFSLCSSLLSPIIDFQKPCTFLALLSVCSCLSFFNISMCPSLSLSICLPLHPPHPPLSLSHSLSLLIFPCFLAPPYLRHLSQQSMPFHSGEGTNGIPAESVAAGGEQRFFCDSNSPCLPPRSAADTPACTRSLSPPHT